MIYQNKINKPHSLPAIKKAVPVELRVGMINKKPNVCNTEIKIISRTDDFNALEQEWQILALVSDTLIFQTYEWNRIWWKHFGATKNLHIVAVYTANKLIGLAPLFEDDVTFFGRKVYSCLRFLGSYVSQPEGEPLMGGIPYSDYLDCIVHPEYEEIFYKRILQHFNEVKSEFDEILLDEVSEESAIYNTMIPLMGESNYRLPYKTEPVSSRPVILLSSTWEAYLNSLNVKDRYNARRYFKRSNQADKKAFKIERIKHAEKLPGALSHLIRMHQQQWNSRGFAGTFSEERMRNFFIEIAQSFFEKNWIEFNMAVPTGAEIKYVAVDILLTYKNRVYLMHRGMDEDPLYRKQGPGNVLLYARVNEAINDGMKVFDMLRGTEDFKTRMATKIIQHNKIIVCSGFKSGKFLPIMIKKYLKIIHHFRTEKSQAKLVLNGKSFFKGLTDFIQFLQRRIKYKL